MMGQNKKTFYFVRHGESESNAGGLRQGGNSPLTPKGFKQAEAIGRRLAQLPVDIIVSSDFVRAKQTAETIAAITGHSSITESSLLVERSIPSRFDNTTVHDPESKDIVWLIQGKYGDLDWRCEDAENGRELVDRAKAALQYLVSLPQDNVVVVTHGYFMRFLVAEMMFKGELHGEHFVNFLGTLITKNTGITICEHHPARTIPWKLLTWNDHAHLQDLIEELPEEEK